MLLQANGIVLERVTPSTCQELRRIRQTPSLRPYMHYQGEIRAEQQAAWFARRNTAQHHYFFIKQPLAANQPLDSLSRQPALGVIHLHTILWDRRQAEAGLYLPNPADWGSPWPVLASLTLLEWAFACLGLQQVWALSRADNPKAHGYNRSLGFAYHPERSQGEHWWFVAEPETFLRRAAPLRRAAFRLYGVAWNWWLGGPAEPWEADMLSLAQAQPGLTIPDRHFRLGMGAPLHAAPSPQAAHSE